MKPLGRARVQFEQCAPRFILPIFVASTPVFDHRNANARAKFAHRFGKIDVLVFHDKAKNPSADAAPEAVEGLPLRAHVKRRRFFLMKRAQGFEISARSLNRKIRADHLDDVIRRSDLFDCL